MMRRLALVSMDWTRPKDPPLSLGHASILSTLRKRNIPTVASSWSVNTAEFSPKKVTQWILQHKPPIDVGIGVYVWNEKATQCIIKELKEKHFNGRIILGGPQISYLKQDLEKHYAEADVFIRGYAEEVLADFLQMDKVSKGVHIAGTIDKGHSAMADLEHLPSPLLTGEMAPQNFIRWETQRGCPFRCTFCQHRESDVPTTTTTTRRFFSKNRIIQEANWICNNRIINDIAVLDPTFNSGPYYLNTLDQLISGEYRGKLALQCRIEMIKQEFLERVVQLNRTARVVLEFGLQTIHKSEQRVIDRVSNMKLVESNLEKVQEKGIEMEVSLIFGLPAQTLQSFKESVDFCRKFKFSKIHAFPLMLLQGTELYYRKKELGLCESNEMASDGIPRVQEHIAHVVSSPSFTYSDWKKMAEIAAKLECAV